MEGVPDSGDFRFRISDNEIFEATPRNAYVFLHNHEEDSVFDHIFLITSENPDDADEGYFCWREGVEYFDDITDMMRDSGFTVIEMERVSVGDREAYFRSHQAELPAQELTMRQERFMGYWKYLLQHDRIMADDFLLGGEMYI
jgi:hypothetical protein